MQDIITRNLSAETDHPWVRRILLVDGVGCALSALVLLPLARPIADLLGVNDTLPVIVTGLILLVVAAFILGVVLRGSPLVRSRVNTVVGINIAWVSASTVVLLTDPWGFSPAGVVIVAVQAVIVAGAAFLEWVLWRYN